VALVFAFLPGMLIALAGLPVWLWLGHHPKRKLMASPKIGELVGNRSFALATNMNDASASTDIRAR